MIRKIVESSLNYRYLILAIAVAIIIFGIAQLPKMPMDALPEFDPPVVEIQTEALGLSADEVESLVTLNIEEFLNGVPWLKSITSESVSGLSSIRLTFEPGTDLMRARQVVQESLSLAYTLPNVSKPPIMLQPLSTTRRAMMVGLSSKKLSPIEVSVLAQWTIKPRLLGVPGVANVVIWGKKNRELQVQIDPKRLKELGLTQEQIIKTTGDALWVSQLSYLEASLPGTGGWIDTPNQRLGIRHVSPITSPKDLARLPIEGTKYQLGEVANVVEGHQPLVGDTYLEGDSGLILVIEKFPDADTVEVTRGVEKALHALQLGLPGLEIDTHYFNLSNYIESSMKNLGLALLISAILIFAGIILLLHSWRAALISLISITLSLMLTTLIIYWSGAPLNLMIIAGFAIAIAAIIDDQIVGIENVVRRISEIKKSESKKLKASTILNASLEFRRPMIYATIVMLLAILPVFLMGGITGSFFHPLAVSYVLALIISLVIALTITPVLSYIFFSPKSSTESDSPIFNKITSHYENTLPKVIENPKVAYIAGALLIVIGILAWPFFSSSLLPDFKDRDLLIEIDASPGVSHKAVSRIVNRISKELRELTGIQRVVAHSGHAVTGDQITGIYSSQVWVTLDPNANFNKTYQAVEDIVDGYKGLDRDVHTYLTDVAKDAISEEKEAVIVRLYGIDRQTLKEKADEVKQGLSTIAGIRDIQVEGQVNEPHVEVKVDMDKAAKHGIKPGDVRRAASTIFAGITVGNIFEEQKIFDVVVWGTPNVRNSVKTIQDVLIDKPEGGYVRLGDVAEVKIISAPTVIYHEAISPRMDIVANVDNSRSLKAVTQDVEAALKKINFPLEHHPEILGEYTEIKSIKRALFILGFAAALVIFFILQACFNSWSLALLALLALPAAIAGGVLAVAITGGVISIASLLGILAVGGIAARQVISLISYYQDLEQTKNIHGSQLVIRGVIDKFMSILATPIITILALLPFLFFGNKPGLEIIHPMAMFIVAGLITSTLLVLFLIPPLYLLVGFKAKPTSQKNAET